MLRKFYKISRTIKNEDIQKFDLKNRKIGVLAYIKNEKGEILLQQRGIKSRDENELYEYVGGSVEWSDTDFEAAIIREMSEEMGNDVNISNLKTEGIYHCEKSNINWVFVIFKGDYIGGDIKIMEPEKCLGYKFFKYDEAIKNELISDSCRFLTKAIEEQK